MHELGGCRVYSSLARPRWISVTNFITRLSTTGQHGRAGKLFPYLQHLLELHPTAPPQQVGRALLPDLNSKLMLTLLSTD
jgi:hypothetical protein